MPAPFVENAVFFPLYGFSSLVKGQVTIAVWIHFWIFNFIPLIYLSVAVPVPCSFYHNCSAVQLVVRDGDSTRGSLIVENSFCYPRFFVIPDLKLYYRAIVIKTAWHWNNDRQVDQRNRIEDLEMNAHTYSHLIFDKGAKTIKWKKDSIFNNWCWHNWLLLCRRMRIDPYLSPCTKVKSK